MGFSKTVIKMLGGFTQVEYLAKAGKTVTIKTDPIIKEVEVIKEVVKTVEVEVPQIITGTVGKTTIVFGNTVIPSANITNAVRSGNDVRIHKLGDKAKYDNTLIPFVANKKYGWTINGERYTLGEIDKFIENLLALAGDKKAKILIEKEVIE